MKNNGFSAYRYVGRVVCPFARGLRGPPVFCPKASHPVVQLAHCVWTPDYPIDRGKKAPKRKSQKNMTRRVPGTGLRTKVRGSVTNAIAFVTEPGTVVCVLIFVRGDSDIRSRLCAFSNLCACAFSKYKSVAFSHECNRICD